MLITGPFRKNLKNPDKFLSQVEVDLQKKITASRLIISSQKNLNYNTEEISNNTYFNKSSAFSFIKKFLKNTFTLSDSDYKSIVTEFEIKYSDVEEIEYEEIISNLDNALLTLPKEGYIVSGDWFTKIELLCLDYKEVFRKILTLKKVSSFLKNLVNEIYRNREKTYRACPLKLTSISYFDLLFSLKKDNSIFTETIKGIINKNFFTNENKYIRIYSTP